MLIEAYMFKFFITVCYVCTIIIVIMCKCAYNISFTVSVPGIKTYVHECSSSRN